MDAGRARDERKRGQDYALGIAVLGIVCGSLVTMISPTAGTVIGGTLLAVIVTAFLTRQRVAAVAGPTPGADGKSEERSA